MPRLCLSACVLTIVTLASGVFPVAAQNFPSRPIRIVTAQVGGSNDFAARLIGPELSRNVGQPVVVENRGGILAGDIVSKAPADGHTLLLYGSTIWLLPLFQSHVPYEMKDFLTITTTNNAPNLLVVYPGLAAKSVKELIAVAKARPGELNFGMSAPSSSQNLAGVLFNVLAGVRMQAVPYKGVGPALIDVMAGQIHVMFPTGGAVKGFLESGKLRALAVASAKPSRLHPDLPTVASSLPGYESTSVWGMLAPSGTPSAIVNRLNREFLKVLQKPEMIERFFAAGLDTEGSTPQAFAAVIKTDSARWAKLIKDGVIATEK